MNNKIISFFTTIIFCMISETAYSSTLTKDEVSKINEFSSSLENMGRDIPPMPGRGIGGRKTKDPTAAEEQDFENAVEKWREKYADFQKNFEADLKGILELCVKAGNAQCNDKCVKLWDMYKSETQQWGNKPENAWASIPASWGKSAHIIACHGALETFKEKGTGAKQTESAAKKLRAKIPLFKPKKDKKEEEEEKKKVEKKKE